MSVKKAVVSWAVVRDAIRVKMREQEISFRALSDLSGVPTSTLGGALRDDSDPSWSTVSKILPALGLSLEWVHSLKAGRKAK